MWVGGWVGQPKSRGANLTPPPVSLSKGLVQPPPPSSAPMRPCCSPGALFAPLPPPPSITKQRPAPPPPRRGPELLFIGDPPPAGAVPRVLWCIGGWREGSRVSDANRRALWQSGQGPRTVSRTCRVGLPLFFWSTATPPKRGPTVRCTGHGPSKSNATLL